MSLKAELETWAAALKAYDEQDFEKALDLFSRIADSSKILTNMGLIYATLGEHEAAVERFIEATSLDQYLAVAYFQCGVSNFLLTRYDLAFKDFEQALFYLRGNQAINYEQLGLKFRLFSAEVLYNKGLSLIYMGRVQDGLQDMQEASRDKAIDDHKVIDEAIRDRGEGYMVFSVPVGVLYRPSEKKLKNAAQRDFLGKPILVAASDANDAFTTFTGSTRLKQGITPTGVYVDGADTGVSRSASLPTVTPGTKTNIETTSPTNIERAKTTIVVPPNARELTSPATGNNNSAPSPTNRSPGNPEAALTRAPTQTGPSRVSPGMGIGGPVRGLSVRKPPGSAPAGVLKDTGPTPPPKAPQEKDNRLTEFYDDYLDSYADSASAPAVPKMTSPPSTERVAAWARGSANAPPPAMSRNGSRSAPGSSYAPSAYGSMRRKPSRRRTQRSRMQSTYEEEEEEGYASGEYDDGYYELMKIRIKIHYKDDIRGMALTPDMSFAEFMDKLAAKFDKSVTGLGLKFQDEDGGKVTLADESDFELAIETARAGSKGGAEGRLEIWCTDR